MRSVERGEYAAVRVIAIEHDYATHPERDGSAHYAWRCQIPFSVQEAIRASGNRVVQHAPVHCRAIEKAEGAKLIALCDEDSGRAGKLSKEFGGDVHTDYREMLRRDDVHVIGICTPTSLHPDQTELAAEQGKHVICEKPMATNLQDARKMIDACEQNGVMLAVIFQRRAGGVWPALKKFVEAGRLGKLRVGDA